MTVVLDFYCCDTEPQPKNNLLRKGLFFFTSLRLPSITGGNHHLEAGPEAEGILFIGFLLMSILASSPI